MTTQSSKSRKATMQTVINGGHAMPIRDSLTPRGQHKIHHINAFEIYSKEFGQNDDNGLKS